MDDHPEHNICARIAQIRLELAGARGKAAFAKQLGISPTTYQSYETHRPPPADVLVRIADRAEVDLRWLLTGEAAADSVVPASHPVVQRAARMLSRCPDAAAPLAAFVEILGQSMKFPDKGAAAASQDKSGTSDEADAGVAPPRDTSGSREVEQGRRARADWIPILGRSAAGVPHFWAGEDDSAGLTTLADLIARHAKHPQRDVHRARMQDQAMGTNDAVQLITVTAPEENEPAEFIATGPGKYRYGDAFAVRIDGESMSPDIRHGDLVILSPSEGPVDGKPAVVQLKRQIGVTCKLFRREAGDVHLIPINEQFPPRTFRAEQVVWALRVLGRVRVEGDV